MRKMGIMAVLGVLGWATAVGLGAPPASQPYSLPELRLAANRAFAQDDFASALPLLRELRGKIDPASDEAASIDERIRACMRQLGTMAPATAPADSGLVADSGTDASKPPAVLDLWLNVRTAMVNKDYMRAIAVLQQIRPRVASDPTQLAEVDSRIRACQKLLGIDPATQPAAAAPASTMPVATAGNSNIPVPTIQQEKRTPHVRPPEGQVMDTGIRELGNFYYDPTVGGVPDDIKALNGIRIKTHGFMIPLDQAENIKQFAIVPSLFACCQYGTQPQIQHNIVVYCPAGKSVHFAKDEISVEGTLHVEEKKDDGYVISLFEIDCTSITPYEQP